MGKVPQSVSKVSDVTQREQVLNVARRLNVGLHRFPDGMVPTVAQIQHAHEKGQDLYFSDKTNPPMSWQAAKPGNGSGSSKQSVSSFSVSDWTTEVSDLFAGWLRGQRSLQSPIAHVLSASISGNTVTLRLDTEQTFTLTIALQQPAQPSSPSAKK